MRFFRSAAINVELRSVNHRYLDLQFRLPEDLRALEAGLREIVVGKLQRGGVDPRERQRQQQLDGRRPPERPEHQRGARLKAPRIGVGRPPSKARPGPP